jgi:hypothetical protein
MTFRWDLDYPKLLKEYLEGEKIAHLCVKYYVNPADILAVVRRLERRGRQRSGRRKKWLQQRHPLPVAAD